MVAYPSDEEMVVFARTYPNGTFEYAAKFHVQGLLELLEGIGVRVMGMSEAELLEACAGIGGDLRSWMCEHLERQAKNRRAQEERWASSGELDEGTTG